MKICIYYKAKISYSLRDLYKKPLGGTITSVLKLYEAFKKKGYNVILHQEYHRVFNETDSDLLIVMRNPVAALKLSSLFKKVIFWTGDDIDKISTVLFYNHKFRNLFFKKIQKVVVVSAYQKNNFISNFGIPNNNIDIIENGVDFHLFSNTTTERQNICMFTCLRGESIKYLIPIWNKIVNSVPDSRLKVFSSKRVYGELESKESSRLYHQISNLNNAMYNAPISQPKLAKELMRAKLLLFPTAIPETSSLIVLEARAAGCVVITSSTGALKETAKGNFIIDGNPETRVYQKKFSDVAIKLLKNTRLWKNYSSKNLKSIKYLSWDNCAAKFEKYLLQ